MAERDGTGAELARAASRAGVSVAVAESLTGGGLASRLAQLPDASEWFRGSIVAYAASVKHKVLGVRDVPVVSEPAARAMVEAVASLFEADVAIAVTGEAGPDPQDDVPVGTVWMALCVGGRTTARRRQFHGDATDIVRATCDDAVAWLTDHVVGRTSAG
jgi:nicotinamide-nucleotide amidase